MTKGLKSQSGASKINDLFKIIGNIQWSFQIDGLSVYIRLSLLNWTSVRWFLECWIIKYQIIYSTVPSITIFQFGYFFFTVWFTEHATPSLTHYKRGRRRSKQRINSSAGWLKSVASEMTQTVFLFWNEEYYFGTKNSSEVKFQNSIKSVKFLLDKEIQFSVHVKPFIFVLYPNKLELGRINRNTRTGNVKTSKTSEKCQKMPFSFQKFQNSE